MEKKKSSYKLGSKTKGKTITLDDLRSSGMPLRQTLASGLAPSACAKKSKSK